MEPSFWRGRSVLVTGHTGFKGAWLSLWLQSLGARVTGLALEPVEDEPLMFRLARVDEGMDHRLGTVLDPDLVRDTMASVRPSVVFHLAAQALVGRGYDEPVATFATNVMGTVNCLEAVRRCPDVRAVVVVTSDKCYENQELARGYREDDPLGGHDPYSCSKACAELVTASWRASFAGAPPAAALATVRAGNVIGGGDPTPGRLVPDVLRSLDEGSPPVLRNPGAVRPWQHVLEPLAGYLALAERLAGGERNLARAFNFGPGPEGTSSVACVARMLQELLGAPPAARHADAPPFHETSLLTLDASLARRELGWTSVLSLERALGLVAAWHRAWRQGEDMRRLSLEQIAGYASEAFS